MSFIGFTAFHVNLLAIVPNVCEIPCAILEKRSNDSVTLLKGCESDLPRFYLAGFGVPWGGNIGQEIGRTRDRASNNNIANIPNGDWKRAGVPSGRNLGSTIPTQTQPASHRDAMLVKSLIGKLHMTVAAPAMCGIV